MTFAIRYGKLLVGLLTLLGTGPSVSGVEVTDHEVRVRMGWAFQARIPRSSIVRSGADDRLVTGWGVHGFRGRWLVNGSSQGLVFLKIAPPAAARVLGVPVKLTQLRTSLEDPQGFLSTVKPGQQP